MLLLEIAAQGVRGVSPAGGSARLRPGYDLVPFDGAALRRLLQALFHPAPGDVEALGGGAAGGALRGGVTVLGDDGGTWRLVRDFAVGAQLQRLDPERRAFAVVAREPAAVAAALAERVGAPSAAAWSLFGVAASELPSRRGAPAAPPAPARRSVAPGDVDRRRAELKDELARAERAEKLQHRLDLLQTRLFKLEESLRDGTRLREAAAEAAAALDACAPVAAVEAQLGDVQAKLAAHGKAVARREEGLAKVAADRAALDAEEARGAPRAPWRDLRFWAGAAVGAGALAAGLATPSGQALRYVSLLDIPAFGWSTWIALGWVEALEEHGRLGRRRKLVEEHEHKVEETFARESEEVRGALAAARVANVAELRDALERLAEARQALDAARARVAELEAGGDARVAEEERAQVERELKDVEQALAAEAGGFVRDPRSVEAELDRLEEEAARAPAAAAAASPAAAPAPEPPAPPLAAAADALGALLDRTSRALGESPAALARDAHRRAGELLEALSSGRFSGMAPDPAGRLAAQAAGRAVVFGALAPADRDLVYLSLHLALLERALAGRRRMAVVDDVFAAQPEAVRRIAGRVLKQLARPGQLLHATGDAACRESADHVVQAAP